MYNNNRSEQAQQPSAHVPQQWSVHAEFTISHPGAADPDNQPRTHTEQNEDGVRMTYTWHGPSPDDSGCGGGWSNPPSASASKSSIGSGDPVRYGYQKGNLFFTSTPPKKEANASNGRVLGIQDSSGYGSDLMSPNSLASGSLPRPILPYNRKCRSTCNITLSANVADKAKPDVLDPRLVCGRTQSLRCQTPTMRCEKQDSFYGCGDPWCHHTHYADEFNYPGRCSPVLEGCESCQSSSKLPTRASTFSCPLQKDVGVVNKKDACVQTTEMIDKCTSPFLKMGNVNKRRSPVRKYNRHRTEPLNQRAFSPNAYTPDSLESSQQSVPALAKSKKPRSLRPPLAQSELSDQSKGSDSSKKPRTVHIDVYCTGTEIESDASVSDTENDTASTPQTVFESGKVCITRQSAKPDELPFHLQDKNSLASKSNKNVKDLVNERIDVSDDESTAYPSKLSSYSTIRDFSSSIYSIPKSWTTNSSMTVPDDCESVATSWKDTFSDIDSLLQSRSSITQTESLDQFNRRLYNSNSIDETPEIENKGFLDTPSNASLQYSDSFEYANSEDRLRIKKMEDMWKNKANTKQWKSPQSERKQLLLQQKKMQDYIAEKLGKKDSKDSDSDSDDSVKGWTFVKNDDQKLDRDGTIKRKGSNEDEEIVKEEIVKGVLELPRNLIAVKTKPEEAIALKAAVTETTQKPKESQNENENELLQRLTIGSMKNQESSVATLANLYSGKRFIANRFGGVVSSLRKPGHHVGPAKNPACSCDHCRRHFESNGGYRNRTRSMGEAPFSVPNWRKMYERDTVSSDRTVDGVLYKDC